MLYCAWRECRQQPESRCRLSCAAPPTVRTRPARLSSRPSLPASTFLAGNQPNPGSPHGQRPALKLPMWRRARQGSGCSQFGSTCCRQRAGCSGGPFRRTTASVGIAWHAPSRKRARPPCGAPSGDGGLGTGAAGSSATALPSTLQSTRRPRARGSLCNRTTSHGAGRSKERGVHARCRACRRSRCRHRRRPADPAVAV